MLYLKRKAKSIQVSNKSLIRVNPIAQDILFFTPQDPIKLISIPIAYSYTAQSLTIDWLISVSVYNPYHCQRGQPFKLRTPPCQAAQ